MLPTVHCLHIYFQPGEKKPAVGICPLTRKERRKVDWALVSDTKWPDGQTARQVKYPSGSELKIQLV